MSEASTNKLSTLTDYSLLELGFVSIYEQVGANLHGFEPNQPPYHHWRPNKNVLTLQDVKSTCWTYAPRSGLIGSGAFMDLAN